ncbi:hypothetical protein ACXIT0_16955, partial [Methylorubrum extorquens]
LRARLASEHHEDAGPGRKVLLHPLSLFRRKRASSWFSSRFTPFVEPSAMRWASCPPSGEGHQNTWLKLPDSSRCRRAA